MNMIYSSGIRVVCILTFQIIGLCFGKGMDGRWVEEGIRRHNEFRRGFGALPLILNEMLCGTSLAHAKALTRLGSLEHGDLGFGENLFVATGRHLEIYGSTPVDAWYNEIKHYNFQTGFNGSSDVDDEVGTFTQLVWKGTREMCISYAANNPSNDADSIGSVYVVAHYLPKGNIEGYEHGNVTPLNSSPFFYKDSETAPLRRHLSAPIGSTGELLAVTFIGPPERSCWRNSEFNAEEVTTPNDFIDGTLKSTNHIRQQHNVNALPTLIRNSSLCHSAQGWAEYWVNFNGTNQKSPNDTNTHCGELFYKATTLLKPNDLIDLWYLEGQAYEFNHHRTSTGESAVNFIRLLWKDTEEMCVAYAKTKDGKEYVYVGVVYQNQRPNYDDFSARQMNIFSSASGIEFCFIVCFGTFILQFLF